MSALSIRALGRIVLNSKISHSVILHPFKLTRRSLSSTAVETAPAPALAVSAVAEPTAASSTLWTKLVAFCGGVAVGGAYFLYLNYTGDWRVGGTETHDASSHVHAENVAAANMISQQRLAALEHEVVALRTEIEARA